MNKTPGTIFGNPVAASVWKKAEGKRRAWVRRFGDDSGRDYRLAAADTPVLGPLWDVRNLRLAGEGAPAAPETGAKKPLVIGTIRMGYGHYRISMAIASAAAARGLQPWWFDLHSFEDSVGGKVVRRLNDLYSFGSRLSQKSALFNRLYWEPLNAEGFRSLEYNAQDQAVSALFAGLCRNLPPDAPFVATHVWPAQAAVHAGRRNVVNVIPDNWPMALHLAEGALHTVQTPSSYWGYRTLSGMDKKRLPSPMPAEAVAYTGHYIDHELVVNLEADAAARSARRRSGEPLRLLLTVGGAGAQREYYEAVIEGLAPDLLRGRVQLLINAGDHQGVARGLEARLKALGIPVRLHSDWSETSAWAAGASGGFEGNHLFCQGEVFAAVYTTNLLMRLTDVLVTKPSELAFYPVPKLLVKRVGGHEAWGAVRAAELGDGTPECPTPAEALRNLRVLLDDREALPFLDEGILRAHRAGVYNGAYRVVDLALNRDRRP